MNDFVCDHPFGPVTVTLQLKLVAVSYAHAASYFQVIIPVSGSIVISHGKPVPEYFIGRLSGSVIPPAFIGSIGNPPLSDILISVSCANHESAGIIGSTFVGAFFTTIT